MAPTIYNRHSSFSRRSNISGTVGSFQSGGALAGLRALTIESSLMSECGHEHEPPEKGSNKLSLRFPVIAPSRSGNTDQRMYS